MQEAQRCRWSCWSGMPPVLQQVRTQRKLKKSLPACCTASSLRRSAAQAYCLPVHGITHTHPKHSSNCPRSCYTVALTEERKLGVLAPVG